MNKFKNPQPEVVEKPEPLSRGKKMASARKFVRILRVFNKIDKGIFVRFMPFLFFLAVLGLIYIANGYYADRTIREIDRTSKEIKELKSEYITTKAELMQKSIQSEVAKVVEPYGIKPSVVSPKKIVVNN